MNVDCGGDLWIFGDEKAWGGGDDEEELSEHSDCLVHHSTGVAVVIS